MKKGMKKLTIFIVLGLIFISLEIVSATCSVGMISYWKFDEGAGINARDSAGNNDGILKEGPVWTSGKIGGALEFDGADDYVEVPDSSSLNPTEEITVMAWINPTDKNNQISAVVKKSDIM